MWISVAKQLRNYQCSIIHADWRWSWYLITFLLSLLPFFIIIWMSWWNWNKNKSSEKIRARQTEQALWASETDWKPYIQIGSMLNYMYVSTLKIARLFGYLAPIHELFCCCSFFFLHTQMNIEWNCVLCMPIKLCTLQKKSQIHRKKHTNSIEKRGIECEKEYSCMYDVCTHVLYI